MGGEREGQEEKSRIGGGGGLAGRGDVIPEYKTHCPVLPEEVPSTMISPTSHRPPHPLHWEDAFAVSLRAARARLDKSASV